MTVSSSRFRELLSPYAPDLPENLFPTLSKYLDLLLRWNARMNLTAIRDPEEMVRRHFGESLFMARHLPPCETLLDLGSGAGFPGVPIQLVLPNLAVTLAESQSKKASFLREVVRTFALPSEVWGGRVEAMPHERLFHVVTMRAVDHPEKALGVARQRLAPGGTLALLTSGSTSPEGSGSVYKLPDSEQTILHLST